MTSVLIALAVVGAGLVVYLAASKGQAGRAIPVMSDISHIPAGTDPNPYNSNPPTSGIHYAVDLEAGFYDHNSFAYPEGYLVHNLEHGYVIFWYNCSTLSAEACSALKTQIKDVMDEKDNYKLIAYPWEKTDIPLVLTSWGRLLEMPVFDRKAALDFIARNLNHAPEPMAD
ncbi:MAG: DUF3105 domain-containing protein [Anaerolineae bacterium]|nr:DUF3105 domain-containing protein [Anaerolineae bacterium]